MPIEKLSANGSYHEPMARKLSRQRPRQGAHLAALRRAAGLSQAELGRLVGETQQNVAYWEQSDKPPRSDVLPTMAKILGVTVEEILDPDGRTSRRRAGPVGKMQQLFAEGSKLPRRQQQKIIEVVSAMIEQYRREAS
jgi:transcriptional regulator with XRE-family HTH domain